MDSIQKTDEERSTAADKTWWHALGVLYLRRKLILTITGLFAVVSVIISLLLPNWYKASSRLLLPESSSGGLSAALLGDLSSAAQSLLGGAGGDYVRYLAILNSRSVLSSAVDSFNLVQVYDLEDSDTPREDAIELLAENVEFAIDDEFDFLSVEALDRDPVRAADLSNFFVRALDRVQHRLSSQTAGNFRVYVEERYAEAEHERAALLDSLAAFQRHYGVYDLEAQTAAYFEQIANLRVNSVQAEIQYEALKNQFGEGNAQVRAFGEIVAAAERQYESARAGNEPVLPVSQENTPIMIKDYLTITLDRTIQEKILEVIAPLREQARFEEQKVVEALQVVDYAIPPVEKYKPKRSVIVIAATLSAFILAVLYALITSWWKTNSAYFARRLSDAASTNSQSSV